MSKTRKTYELISLPNALGVLFVALKLCGVIDWSWWWVTCPFWIPIGVLLTIAAGGGLVWLTCALILGAMDLWGRRGN